MENKIKEFETYKKKLKEEIIKKLQKQNYLFNDLINSFPNVYDRDWCCDFLFNANQKEVKIICSLNGI